MDGSSGKQNEKNRENQAEKIGSCLMDVSPSICKINFHNVTVSGFLIKLDKHDGPLFCLMTNGHIFTNEMIQKKETIDIFYNDQKNLIRIKLNNNERYIKNFLDLNIDCLIVEILSKDKINEDYFLFPNIDYINNVNKLKDKEIYIMQYPKGTLSFSKGEIKDININEFSHNANTDYGSSGSPIFLLDTNKVIGIHKSTAVDERINFGDFIFPIINILKN